jgi:ferritin
VGFEAIRGKARKAMKSGTFHLEAGQVELLRQASEKLRISQSEIVRQSIANFLKWFKREQAQEGKKKKTA